MKYSLNKVSVDLGIDQKTISDSEIDFHHNDLVQPGLKWYTKGYKPVPLPSSFFDKIKGKTTEYIDLCMRDTLAARLDSLERYHGQLSDEQHMAVIRRMGKLIPTALLGVDIKALEAAVKTSCGIDHPLYCQDVCDIRLFRPYRGHVMDNNPLHRDTWLPVLNNCINVYIPVAGNTRLSSLSLIPGSHLWDRADVDRTASNAMIKGIQYGLPSVSAINRKYRIVRPTLRANEVLLFSSAIIHGGAINLNKDTTRVSIEIRFWREAFPLR